MDAHDDLVAQTRKWQAVASQGIATERELRHEIERLRGHLKWFCDRVEAGEVRSKRTYERFKEELEK